MATALGSWSTWACGKAGSSSAHKPPCSMKLWSSVPILFLRLARSHVDRVCRASRGCDEPVRHCVFDEVGRRMDVKLFHDLGLVKLNGTMRNLQLVGDFFRGQSLGH